MKKEKKLQLCFVFFILCSQLRAQEKENIFMGKELHNKVRLNFIPVAMPTEKFSDLKPTMGLMGLHYQIPITDWLYGGAAMYAAVTGDQGGLFTLGIELGVTKKIYKYLYLDANFHFGGGGGYRYLVNDGGYINPNIGLQFKKKDYSFGVQYSHIDFYSGEIKSNSVSFFIEIPSTLKYSNHKNSFQEFKKSNINADIFWNKPATRNAQQLRFDFFKPIGNSRKDNGKALTETLYVVGFEYQKFLKDNTFLFVHTDAVYKGLRAGFMDLFFGAGYYPYQYNRFSLFTKLALGAAGGRVAPEGGLMIYPSAGVDIKLTNRIALSGHGGYYRAIAGDLEAYTFGFGLKYTNYSGGTYIANKNENNNLRIQGSSFRVENQSYLDVAKTDDSEGILAVDLQLLSIQYNYDLSKHVYVLGEAGFAYDGRSGGYAHGLVGLGLQSKSFFNNRIHVFAEIAGGAAGGAGVDTGEGIVVRPTAGINYNINSNFAITASGGKLIAPFGNVNATNINIGCKFSLSSLSVLK
ncbi:hypothetical protein BSU00_02055 [Tenacibaculum sp. SG-28]|nr:hypothetical protein BSU00_02055 [Tenacibaculum sp. SG-28]